MRAWQESLRLLVLLAAGFAGLSGCGGKGANGPHGDLPPYTGRAAELFDDGIDGAAVGYALEPGPPPSTDAKLRERVQTGDAIVRARVVTVTSQRQDTGRSWQLGMHTLEKLAGSGSLDADFALDVEATDPGAGMVKAFESSLVGATFVVAVRTFAHAGTGDADLHFHLLADKPDVLAAIKEATLLQQVK
jgi:hypothetical protein